jgi:predicted nucleotidyltransferase
MGGLVDEHDQESAAMKKTLRGLTAVKIRSYRFDSDFVYARADIDGVRSQLSGAGWSQLARVRDRKSNEDVDVYVALDGPTITGFAVIDSKPREFTIVNIVGKVDVAQVSKLQLQLGLPDVGVARLLPHMQ